MFLKNYQQKVIDDFTQALENGFNNTSNTACFKIPTGGGKTILAGYLLERYFVQTLCRRTGLVVWLVPTETIYSQTLQQLRNLNSPLRQVLERLSFGKVRVLTKNDPILDSQVNDSLCILIIINNSVVKTNKEGYRFYEKNDSLIGNFYDFNKSTSDYQKQFYEQNKENLEFINEDNIPESHKTYLPVLSLSNTVKYHNPVVLVDEAHKFQGDNAQSCLQLLNPKFIIELSATPLLSQSNNTISEVHGIELWNESMIKLPIQYDSITNSNKSTAWTQLLNKAIAQLDDLQNCASNGNESMYVRPIMVVRTDYIDEKKKAEIKVKKPDAIFPSDVIQYLKSNGFGEQQIRIKTSITNEIKQENLLSKNCPVRVIITKDALKEGWDCSFAYVLVNLVKPSSRAKGLITQLVGRVLRQPYAKRFKQAELNSCYVFYNESEDGVDLYEQIRNELCAEQGLDGIDNLVVSINKNNVKSVPKPNNKKLVNRNANFTSLDLLLPKITNNGREIDYYRDIYPKVDFNNFSLTQSALTKIQIEYNNCLNNPWYNYKKIGYTTNTQTNSIYKLNDVNDFEAIGFLSEIILNPFVASKIWGTLRLCYKVMLPQ